MGVQDLERIEGRLDKVVAGGVAVSDAVGGVLFQNMAQVMEFAKLLSLAGTAVPRHLRGNPGACLAVTIQALEWRMSPVAVANKSYEVNDRIAYEAQLIHAVVEARAPLKQRLRFFYDGEGETLTCTVKGHIRGEVDPLEYTSPAVGKIKVKNSPLWLSDPRQQLSFYSVRAWARRYCPDVLLGIYAEDELDRETPGENAKDVTPGLKDRLSKKGRRGFSPDNVAALEHKPGETLPEAATASPQPEPVTVAAGVTAPATAQSALTSEPEMRLGHEIDNEVAEKKRALLNCKSEDDVKAISEAITALIRQHKRQDLLADFLSAVRDAEKRVTPK